MGSPANILVTDDELIVVSLVEDCLVDAGHEVMTATCGSEAVALLEKHPFDLLITDIRMPDFDGIELLRRAKKIQPEIGAIFMTGYANVESAKDAIKEGALDYLMKPFEIDEIRNAAANALKKLEEAQEVSGDKELERMSVMTSLMNSVEDIDSLIRMSLSFALLQCEIKNGSAVYWSPEDSEIVMLTVSGEGFTETSFQRLKLSENPFLKCEIPADGSDVKDVILCQQCHDHPLYSQLADGVSRSQFSPPWLGADEKLVSFALRRPNCIFGYLLIAGETDSGDELSKEHKFMRVAAQQTALSIENFLLLGETRDAYQKLQDLQERAIQMETAAVRGEFAGEIGHELKNFLGVVYGHVSLLQLQVNKEGNESYDKHLAAVISNLDRMKRFTNDLMHEARLTPDKQTLEVTEKVRECVMFLRPQRRFKGVELDIDVPANPVYFETDPMLFQQLVYNLLNNAADACAGQETPRVTVSVEASAADNTFTLNITDNGSGISPEQKEKLFKQRFTTKDDGNGFGLIVCRKIIDSHSGTLEIESELDLGTTFSITFPRENAPAILATESAR